MTEPEARTEPEAPLEGRTIVLSGLSGAGKTTIAASLLRDPRFGRARTATTRPPRGEERDGADYDFLSETAFRAGIERGAFLEYAEVYGRRYGTPRANLDEVLNSGRHCVLVVDVQGAATLRELGFDAYYVFVEAPGFDELRRRLQGRGNDSPEEIERRLAAAQAERAHAAHFDLVLVNDDVADATRRLAEQAGVDWSPAEE